MAFGTFDIFHPGHLYYLESAKQCGDYLIVVVARDSTVKKIKGKKPKNNEQERIRRIQKVTCIDEAILGNEHNPHIVIDEKKPQVICLGYDQKNFTEDIHIKFPDIAIVRMGPYKPEIYKSSKLSQHYDRH